MKAGDLALIIQDPPDNGPRIAGCVVELISRHPPKEWVLVPNDMYFTPISVWSWLVQFRHAISVEKAFFPGDRVTISVMPVPEKYLVPLPGEILPEEQEKTTHA